jgi:integrase
MCNVRYYLDKRSKKDKKAITMRVNHAGKSFNKGTGISIFPWDWDDKIGYPKDKTSAEFVELAATERLLQKSYEILKESIRDKPSMEALKATFDVAVERGTVDKDNTITGLIDNFIKQKEGIYSESSIKHYTKLKELVYDKFGETLDDNLDHLNKTWGLKFIDYLCYKQGYQNSTVEMYLKKLISVLNFHDERPPFQMSDIMQGMKKSKSVNGDKPYLTFDELVKLRDWYDMNLDKHITSEEGVAFYMFMFASYTGCRFNEILSLKKSDIVKDGDIRLLKYRTTKNGKYITVPINSYCFSIIANFRSVSCDNIFPKISNSVVNKHITNILSEYGLTQTKTLIRYSGKNMEVKEKSLAQLITFHSSRHSFASNLLDGGMTFQEVSDLMGISVQTLMSWYSHSNEEMRNSKALAILNR